jgi:hypothetical protein
MAFNYCPRCGADLKNEPTCSVCGFNTLLIREEVKAEYIAESSLNTCCKVGFILSFFTTFPGLIVSIIGLTQARTPRDKKFAISGIIISAVQIAITVASLVWFFISYNNGAFDAYL